MPRASKNSSRKATKSKGRPRSKSVKQLAQTEPAPDTTVWRGANAWRNDIPPEYFQKIERNFEELGSLLRALSGLSNAIETERVKLVNAPIDEGFPAISLLHLASMLDALPSLTELIMVKRCETDAMPYESDSFGRVVFVDAKDGHLIGPTYIPADEPEYSGEVKSWKEKDRGAVH